MKASITISAVILVVAGILGWQNHARLEDARYTRDRLTQEAISLGLDANELLAGTSAPAGIKSRRESPEDKEAAARDYARRMAAFAIEMKAAEEAGGEKDETTQIRITALIREMLDLDASQLKTVIEELKILPGIDDGMRHGIIGFAIMTMSEDHPAAALAVFTDTPDLLGKEGPGSHVVASALSKLAEGNPLAALDWIKVHGKNHPGLITDRTRGGILAGAARQDPRLAFQLIDDLGFENRTESGGAIASSAKTPAERAAMLSAMRDHLKADGSEASREILESTMKGLSRMMTDEGYASSSAWLESQDLTESESKAMVDGINWWQTKSDTGNWIDWMADKIPPDQFSRKVDDMVSNWTAKDHRAVGEWINASKDGPARQAAARAYAVTVAPYEPETAAQWAETLPPGKDRDEAFQSIHAEWQKKDASAAEEFARKHDIKQ